MSGTRQAWGRSAPCPICGGYPTLPTGRGIRCFGFRSEDGRVAFCTREEHAGAATFSAGANAFAHRLEGPCACGLLHGDLGYRARPSTPIGTARPSGARLAAQDQPRISADTLDAVYVAYLGLLPLRQAHRDYLASRGSADLAVGLEHGYGSLPLGYDAARRVVTSLTARFGIETMRRCPGFYEGRDGRLMTHTARADADALVIPGRDERGRICIMVRRYVTGAHPKYMAFQGADAGAAYTVAGSRPVGGRRQLVVTEGLHKAHVVAHASSGLVVLGLPGAHLSDAHLAAVERLRPDVVIEALDADKFTNPAITRQREHLHDAMTGAAWAADRRVEILTAVWDEEEGKGLDDLLAAGRQPRMRTVARRPVPVVRKPHAIPAPGPVTPGRPLADVQAETENVIRDVVRNRRTRVGRVKVVQVPPGVGKSTAVARAIVGYGGAARILVATKAKALEVEAAFPRIRAVEGRNAQNCRNFAVVEAARRNEHDVSAVVCGQCPGLDDCRVGGYYAQFKRPGPLVAPVELLYSGAFLGGGDLVVLDDPALDRVMIDVRKIDDAKALRVAASTRSGAARELMTGVQRTVDGLRAHQAFAAPLIGAHAWDALARSVGGAEKLVALIRQAPAEQDVMPQPARGAALTVEDIEAAPPAVLARLIRVLKREVDAFLGGREFNSGLSVHPGGLELREIRDMLSDTKTDRLLIQDKAVLILDATPIMPLYERLASGLTLDPVFAPEVALPPNVHVTQAADYFFGKSSVEGRHGPDGKLRPARSALLSSLETQRRRYPGDREAAICAKSLKGEVGAAGIDEDRVLTFFGSRGLNSIEDADVLHVLGRPQAPDFAALLMAHVLHLGEEPIAPHLAMRSEPYAGYRAADGTGRAITVTDFWDRRASVLFRAYRESELLQAVHRARLFRVGSAQLDMFEPDGQQVARTASERRRVRLVIHSSHPIPGLRVDELLYGSLPSVNDTRAVDAAERILAAAAQLLAEGVPVGVNAVARLARARKDVVARVLSSHEFVPARSLPLIDLSIRGGDRAGTNFRVSAPMEPWPSVDYPAGAPLLVGALLPSAAPHAPPLAAFARAVGDGVVPGGAP